MVKLICNVYKSRKKEGMYLYTLKQEELSRVPEALMTLFGSAELSMTMLLTTEKKLGRANASEVIEQVQEKGFYLQMPEAEESEMKEIANKNTKLPRS